MYSDAEAGLFCEGAMPEAIRPDALDKHSYGAVLVPPLAELPVPGEVLLEPMLPVLEPMLPPADDEFGLVAELSEPLTGPEGEVALLSLGEPLLGLAALLLFVAEPPGFIALFDPMLPLELPAVELPLSVLWAKAAGANAATDKARPAPSR
jgi:hypothetical protein